MSNIEERLEKLGQERRRDYLEWLEREREQRERDSAWRRTTSPEDWQVQGRRRQFGALPPEPTIYQRVEQALIDGGHLPGEFHHSYGYETGEPYRPAVTGYVIDRSYIGQLYVDHAGRGRAMMLPRYMTALQAAGFPAVMDGIDCWQEWTRLVPGRAKQVVWLDLWDERLAHRRRQHEERRQNAGRVEWIE